MPDLKIIDLVGDVFTIESAPDEWVFVSTVCSSGCGGSMRGPKVAITPADAEEIIAWLSEEFPVVTLIERAQARLCAAGRNLVQAYGHVRTALVVLVKGLDDD